MTTLAIPLVTILLLAGNLRWIQHLEKDECDCSRDPRRTVIKYFYMLAIAVALAEAWVSFNPGRQSDFVERFVTGPFLVMSLAYVGVALSYVVDLRKKECACFEGQQARMLFWVTLAQAFFTMGTLYLHVRGRR